MAAWKKKFERWKNASSPVDVEEVEALLRRVFGARLREAQSTSHRWHLDVSGLSSNEKYKAGNLPVCVRGRKVIPVYLQNAYEAAVSLNLYVPQDEEKDTKEEEIENHEQND